MSYTIEIKGEASTDYHDLEELNGIDCQDCFSDYFDDTSYDKDVTGGYMKFSYEDGKLYTITSYDSIRLLTQDELKDLGEYTQGQWSDGIGEGFEQNSCIELDGEEVFISPWHRGQKLIITTSEKDNE